MLKKYVKYNHVHIRFSVFHFNDFILQVQSCAYRIGCNSALSLQAYAELQPFSSEMTSSSNFKGLLDLSVAPVLFHLQTDPQLMEYIHSCHDDLENLNSKQVRQYFGCFQWNLV